MVSRLVRLTWTLGLLSAFSPLAAQQDYQIQVWQGDDGWQTYDPDSGTDDVTHEVPAGDLGDERPAQGDDWFEWVNGGKTYRIKKNKIPKETVLQQMQQAADKDLKIKIIMDKDGKLKKTRVQENT